MKQHGHDEEYDKLRRYYDIYHSNPIETTGIIAHYHRLTHRLNIEQGAKVLDVACGAGNWLYALREHGAIPVGIDISEKAIKLCKARMPDGEFKVAAAEDIPLADHQFDLVSCLGALEHFVNPGIALGEMLRVAKPEADFLFLVPNADFLMRRLGIFKGTDQVKVKEDARSIEEWKDLFNDAGLEVKLLWRDLHIFSKQWILRKPWYVVPARVIQASMLPLWPLSWQYQIYYLCRRT